MTNLTAVNLTQPLSQNSPQQSSPAVKYSGLEQAKPSDQVRFGSGRGFLEKITPDISDRDLAKMVHQAYEGRDVELVQKIVNHPELPPAKQKKAAQYFKFYHKDLPGIFKGIKTNDPEPLLKHLPLILFAMPVDVVNRIGHHLDFEKPMGVGLWTKAHESEAESLLLLRHPDLMTRETKHTGKLMEGITSINQFTKRVPDTVCKAWQDIGLLTHAFRFWRFDAEGGPESIMSKFGFGTIKDTEENPFGRGYHYYSGKTVDSQIRSELDPLTHVIFRRGFLMASHPEKGTLVVRNSSKVFGRDLMENPAYFTPNALDVEELENFTPSLENLQEKNFINVLSPKLFAQPLSGMLDFKNIASYLGALMGEAAKEKKGEKADSSAVTKASIEAISKEFGNKSYDKELLFLTEELTKLKKEYAQWKFNGNGFLVNPDTLDDRFTMMQSPGFAAVRNNLKQRVADGKPLPDLAFTHPEYPPFEPYARLPMTPELVNQLDLLLDDDWDVDEKLIEFIQTGVNQHAELVLLKSDDMLDSL